LLKETKRHHFAVILCIHNVIVKPTYNNDDFPDAPIPDYRIQGEQIMLVQGLLLQEPATNLL